MSLLKDVRFGVRSLVKRPGFALVAVVTLALGIGANTAIFSVIDAALLRSLPYREPGRLVHLWETKRSRDFEQREASYPDFQDWRAQSAGIFEGVAGYARRPFTLYANGEAVRSGGASVTANFFDLLGVRAEVGRTFVSGEDSPDAQRAAVITHGLWQRRFGGDRGVVGRAVALDGESYTVVGVLPSEFEFAKLGEAEVWTPLRPTPEMASRRFQHWVHVVARVKDGVELSAARAQMDAVASRIEREDPSGHENVGLRVVPLQEEIVGSIKSVLILLLGAVGFVLLIACTNVANLLLARSTARRREIAIRAALGASRWRIARQLLIESVLLALAGGAAGLVLALWGVDLLVAAIPAAQLSQMPYLRGLSLNADVLLFALGLSLATGVLFGLTPALAASRADLQEAMKEGGRSSSVSRGSKRLRDLLVVSEVALALVLLVGAGLLMKSLTAMLKVDPGFDTSNLLTMRVALPPARYKDDASSARFYAEVLRRVSAVPGVRGVAETSNLPLAAEGGTGTPIVVGRSQTENETGESHLRTVSANYFDVMGLPVVKGRAFDERDDVKAPGVLLVNKTFAERVFPGEDPVGRRVSFKFTANMPPFEIVGVVGDEKVLSLDARTTPVIYFHEQQSPDSAAALVVRAAAGADTDALARAVTNEVRATDSEVPVFAVQTLEQLVAGSRATFMRRYPAYLTGVFACVALLLALVGIYGVISYTVTQRTHEIAVRMALGARTRDVLRLVVGHGLGLALAGVALGAVGALALTRLIKGLLFGVSAADPTVYAAVSALLVLVALVACLAPARRATKVDPMEALRYE
ncbi:MAG TPA: ABC transporter permease [Pyrinomonadaceae bacterium]|nr:ABC transporter permease [Pyrinomonadaceae bacterium]